MSKIRRIDYYPDDVLGGVSGKLSPADFGVYWMVCTLIYSHGGPIDNDPAWLSRLFAPGTRASVVKASIDRLIEAGKLHERELKLCSTRAESELERSAERMRSARENGAKGGRPSNKNKDVEKPDGSDDRKANNQQPATSNHTDTSPSLRSGEGARERDLLGEAPPDPKPPPKRAAKSARRQLVPEDWAPNERSRADAHARNLTDQEIDRETPRFRDHHRSRGNLLADIPAAWRTWCDRVHEFGARGGGRPNGAAAPGGHGQAPGGVTGAYARAAAQRSRSSGH